MRYEQIAASHSYDRVEAPAVWPAEASDSATTFMPTPSAPDMPAAAGGMLVASYAALIGAFALVTAGSARSIFAIAICLFFVAMFFAVPRLFLSVEPKQQRRVGLGEFMHGGIQTLTGHCSGGAALVQMMIVPVLLTFGVLLIGIAKAILL
ncbi:MAG: hypothetical protein QOG72_1617 [Sphingomonadales bacterium]|jgi:hypothetical protein|nr:hypothetical protein [Sphingomonadales bacterium]